MNPLTNMKNLNRMNDRELAMGLAGTSSSWHNEYKDSAWVFVGGLDYGLTEGDVVCVFSQYGEIVHVNLVRDLKTSKSRGFAFVCYENQLSTVLAVDNLNGAKLLGRALRVDHVHAYRLPKDLEKMDEERRKHCIEGCAPKPVQQLEEPAKPAEPEHRGIEGPKRTREKKSKKSSKKSKKKKHSKRRRSSSSSSISSSEGDSSKGELPESSRGDRGRKRGCDRSRRDGRRSASPSERRELRSPRRSVDSRRRSSRD